VTAVCEISASRSWRGRFCSESGGDSRRQSPAYALLRIYIFSPNPRRFIKFNVLYKGRRDGVAGVARHFIPLNFRDKDSPAGNDVGLPPRSGSRLAFISTSILNREDRLKRMEFPCDRAGFGDPFPVSVFRRFIGVRVRRHCRKRFHGFRNAGSAR